jgi:hypothetical protein
MKEQRQGQMALAFVPSVATNFLNSCFLKIAPSCKISSRNKQNKSGALVCYSNRSLLKGKHLGKISTVSVESECRFSFDLASQPCRWACDRTYEEDSPISCGRLYLTSLLFFLYIQYIPKQVLIALKLGFFRDDNQAKAIRGDVFMEKGPYKKTPIRAYY